MRSINFVKIESPGCLSLYKFVWYFDSHTSKDKVKDAMLLENFISLLAKIIASLITSVLAFGILVIDLWRDVGSCSFAE